MNDNELFNLFDDAANRFEPAADVSRFDAMLAGGRSRRRGLVILMSAAASLALLGGTSAAMFGNSEPRRIAPAAEPTEPHDSEPHDSEPKDTEPHDSEPKATEPHDTEPKATEPHDTEPKATEPPATEPPATEPPSTKPPHTEPPKTEPPNTEPPATEPPHEWEWSAFQQYGEGSGEVPYDVFWGTGDPGHQVTISSPYRTRTFEVRDNGTWEYAMEFPGAPIGETFTVTIASDLGTSYFTFTRVAAD